MCKLLLKNHFVHLDVVVFGWDFFDKLARKADSAQKWIEAGVLHFFYINVIESLAVAESLSASCERDSRNYHKGGSGKGGSDKGESLPLATTACGVFRYPFSWCCAPSPLSFVAGI